jgi:uncharacterized protein YxeA
MKKQLILLSVLVTILVCLSIAIVYSNDRQARQQAIKTSEVQKLQATLKQHDQVNETALKDAGSRILTLTQEKATLCTQIKGAKLVQPLCQ